MSHMRGIKEVNKFWLIASLLAWLAVTLVCFGILLKPAIQIAYATKGLLQPTFLFSALSFVVVIFGAIRVGGNLRLRDIGLSTSKIRKGLTITICAWVAIQLVLLFTAPFGEGSSISWNTPVKAGHWTTTLGLLGAQLLGNALVEEAVFRGFLVPQIYFKLGGSRGKILWRPMLCAIIASQLAFALVHIPNLSRLETPGAGPVGQLAMIFLLGVVFALTYIRTANIFVGVGLHALLNRPTPVIRPMVQPEAIAFVLLLLVLALWPLLSGRRLSWDHFANDFS